MLELPNTSSRARIDGEVYCANCAYDLYGQLLDGRCPECGSPIARSLDEFMHAVPCEADEICSGVVEWNLLVCMLCLMTMLVVVFAGPWLQFGVSLSTPPLVVCGMILTAPVLAIALGTAFWSVYQLRQPACRWTWARARRSIRMAALILLACNLATIAGGVYAWVRVARQVL